VLTLLRIVRAGGDVLSLIALKVAVVLHVFGAIALVGSVSFNTLVMIRALKQIPPAQSAVVAEKVGQGLMWLGTVSLAVLGLSGLTRLYFYGILESGRSLAFWTSPYGWRLALMISCWLALVVTGTLSAYWYRTVLTRKLPFSAGLRDLEERRAAQARISAIQDRLAYVNFSLTIAAALGGALLRAGV
jgi:uncharacterized membrane protein